MNPQERRERAEEILDLAMAAAARIAEVEERHAAQERLLRGSLERKQIEIKELRRELAGK